MLSDADRARAIFADAIASGDAASRAEFVARSCGQDEQLRRWVDELLAVFDRAAAAPGQPSINANATTDFGTDAPGPAEPSSAKPTLTRSPVAGTAGGGSARNETTDFSSGDPGDPSAALPTVTFTPDAKHERQRKPKVDAALGTVVGGKYTLESVIGEGGMGSVYLARQSEPVRREVAVKLIKAGFDSRGVLARFEAERQALALMEHPNIARVYDGGTTPGGAPFFAMELVRGVPITDYCDA